MSATVVPQTPQVGPTWPPDKKVWAGGLASILAWALLYGLELAGIVVPPVLQGLLIPAIGYAISYMVPPSVRDIVSRVNNDIVKMANADQTNPTQAVVVDEQTSTKAALIDIKTGAIPMPDTPPPGIQTKPGDKP